MIPVHTRSFLRKISGNSLLFFVFYISGSKRNKDLKGMFRFALSCSTVSAVVDHTVVIDNVMSVYSKESTAADQVTQVIQVILF